jgi:hypothetical protein
VDNKFEIAQNVSKCSKCFCRLNIYNKFLGGHLMQNCEKKTIYNDATNREVAGSIPDGVIWIFHRHNPFGRTMALGLTQPLTEMSTSSTS